MKLCACQLHPNINHMTFKLQSYIYAKYFATKAACQEAVQYRTIRPKLIINSSIAKSRSLITSVSKFSWNFRGEKALSLPCPMQNSKTIEQLEQMLWTNDILRDSRLRWVPDGNPMLHCAWQVLEGYAIVVINENMRSEAPLTNCIAHAPILSYPMYILLLLPASDALWLQNVKYIHKSVYIRPSW